MPAGNGALNPLAALSGDLLGVKVRWSVRASDGEGVVVHDNVGAPGTLVLACNDRDGDSTAISLERREAEDLRDGLAAWLADT